MGNAIRGVPGTCIFDPIMPVQIMSDTIMDFYRIQKMTGFLSILMLCWLLPLRSNAQDSIAPGTRCVVCEKPILQGRVYKHAKGIICESCFQIVDHCSVCGLPVRDGYGKTGDGRLICKRDLPNVVLEQAQLEALFKEATHELYRLSGGQMTLKHPDVHLQLFDVDYWNYQNGTAVPSHLKRLGMSRTTRKGDRVNHSVIVQSAQLKAETLGVCMHEFTHLWINEVVPTNRVIDPDTLEALCELMTYKVHSNLNQQEQMERVLINPYTNGKTREFVKLEEHFGMQAILTWITQGTEAQLNESTIQHLAQAPIFPTVSTAPPVARTGYDRLKLMGILGSKSHRQAMINGKPFGVNEEFSLTLDGNPVQVRCMEIGERSAVVKVQGSNAPITLYLNQ